IFRSLYYGYQIAVNPSGKAEAFVCDPNPSCRTINGGPTVTDNQWHHIAVTKGSSRIRLYLDGELIADVSMPTDTFYYPGGVAIGRDGANSVMYFHGGIDEVALYD